MYGSLLAAALVLGLTTSPAPEMAPSEKVDRRMAVTVDDLPFGPPSWLPLAEQQAMTRTLLEVLKKHEVPAIGFVNEDKLEIEGKVDPARVDLLKQWLDAGFELGNHGYSHLDLNAVDPGVWEADVLKGERVLRPLLAERGTAPRYFRHPYLRTRPSVEIKRRTEAFLAEHGYVVAPVTIDNQEWIFGREYNRARRNAARKKKLGEAYVDYMTAMVEYYELQSVAIAGREIPQVLLIHTYALNADWLDPLLERIKARGYRFITLSEALEDPIYESKDTFAGRGGITWLHRWAITRGLPGSTFAGEPDLPDWVRSDR